MLVTYSFIVPVYNCASYLSACISSILNQRLEDYELLLIDDGSTDNSGALCDSFASRYAQVHAFHKTNGGAADARNYGLDHANGSFILFIDGDDTISPNYLEQIRTISSADSMGIFGMSFDYYQKDTISRRELLSTKFQGCYEPAGIAAQFHDFFEDNQLSSACNKVFDRGLLERLHLRFTTGMTLYEDMDFVIRYMTHATKIRCLPVALYHYRQDQGGHISHRIADSARLQQNLSRVLVSMLMFYRRYPEKEILSVSATLYLQMLDMHLLQSPSLNPSLLQIELPRYCDDPAFSEILALGGQPGENEARLLNMIRSNSFSDIAASYRRRQMKIRLKRSVKRILGK